MTIEQVLIVIIIPLLFGSYIYTNRTAAGVHTRLNAELENINKKLDDIKNDLINRTTRPIS